MCNGKKNNWGVGSSKCGGEGLTKYVIDKGENFNKIRDNLNKVNSEYVEFVEGLRKSEYEKWGGVCSKDWSFRQKHIANDICERLGYSGGSFKNKNRAQQVIKDLNC